jgi:hypothetical protein
VNVSRLYRDARPLGPRGRKDEGGAPKCFLKAVLNTLHTLEGDLENARHWYRKANRAFSGAVQEEIAAAEQLLRRRG